MALGLTRRALPSIGEFERRIADTANTLESAQSEAEQARAELESLAEHVVDEYGGVMSPDEFSRRRADAERRLVEATAQIEHLDAVLAGTRRRAAEVVEAEIGRRQARANQELADVDHERRRLQEQLAKVAAREQRALQRLEDADRDRLPLLARVDEEAAQQLAQREKQAHDHAVQLAHRRIRGEDVDVPAELAGLVRQAEPLIRAGQAEHRRDVLEHLRSVGTLPLSEHEWDGSGEGVRRGLGNHTDLD